MDDSIREELKGVDAAKEGDAVESLIEKVREEWASAPKKLDQYGHSYEDVLGYILEKDTGSWKGSPFQYGWTLDQPSDAHPRQRKDGKPMRFADFVDLPQVKRAKLNQAHVLVLRLYTTSCFRAINEPLREHEEDEHGEIRVKVCLAARITERPWCRAGFAIP